MKPHIIFLPILLCLGIIIYGLHFVEQPQSLALLVVGLFLLGTTLWSKNTPVALLFLLMGLAPAFMLMAITMIQPDSTPQLPVVGYLVGFLIWLGLSLGLLQFKDTPTFSRACAVIGCTILGGTTTLYPFWSASNALSTYHALLAGAGFLLFLGVIIPFVRHRKDLKAANLHEWRILGLVAVLASLLVCVTHGYVWLH